MPGALIEPLFMTNSGDAALLQRTDVLDSVALAIADGIEEYLWEEGWGSGLGGQGPGVRVQPRPSSPRLPTPDP